MQTTNDLGQDLVRRVFRKADVEANGRGVRVELLREASAALIAGCVRPICLAALVTLRSAMSASKATRRLRSIPSKSMRLMFAYQGC